MSARPTIRDVALHAGVSTATVSRVITAPHRVAGATRERVMAAISALHYQPDAAARALVSGRSKIVGTIIPTLDNSSFACQTQAMQTELAAAGYQLLVAGHEHTPQQELDQVLALQRQGVDALVLVGSTHSPALWKALHDWPKPAVLTWSCDPRVPSIGIDNLGAARTVAQHLIDLGHRHIGVIAGITLHNERANLRVQGVRAAMAQAGLTLSDAAITEQAFGLDGGRDGLRILMGATRVPTAIFCGNDLLAAGALLEAARMGIDVPGRLSICGFDNMDLARALNPGLTTVDVPTRALGRMAALAVLGLLAGESVAMCTLLPFQLVTRASTGPAPPA